MSTKACDHAPNIVCYECFGTPLDHDPGIVYHCATCFEPTYNALQCDKCEAEVLAARGEA